MLCSKLDVMVIFKRKILNKGCVFTNHVRNVDDSISAHERCAPGSWHTNQLRRVHDIISAHGGCAIDLCRTNQPTNQEMLAISYARTKSALVISAHGGCASDSCRTNQPRNADDSISAHERCACGSCRVLMMSHPPLITWVRL